MEIDETKVGKDLPGQEDRRPSFSKGKGKGRGKKAGYNKGEGRFKGCRPNDYSWLNYNDEMLKTAAQIPFGKPIGYTHTLGLPLTNAGIVRIGLMLSLGDSQDMYSAINLASKDLAASIRRKNSGSYNWEQADLAIFIGAFSQALAFAGWVQRLIGRVNRFSPLSRYNAPELTKADQVDYDDLILHLPELEKFIQKFCAQLNVFSIPKDLPILANAYMAFRYDYMDINNKKVQHYLFTPRAFGYWNANALTTGSSLLYAALPTTGGVVKVADIIKAGQAMLDALNDDQDCYVMMGDIRKAFEEGELMQVTIPQYPLAAPEPAVYSEEVLWQIKHIEHNVTRLRVADFSYYESILSATPSTANYIDTFNGVIPFHYRQFGGITGIFECTAHTLSTSGSELSIAGFTYDTDVDSPSVEELVNDTRMKCAITKIATVDNATTPTTITGCSHAIHELYIVTGMDVFYNPVNAPIVLTVWSDNLLDAHAGTSIVGTALEGLAYLKQFRYSPFVKVSYGSTREYLFGDVTNFTTVTADVIRGIQLPVLYSLFHCPRHKG